MSDLPAALLSVWGHSASDVWAVGADDGHGPYVLHFDGQTWSRLESGARADLWWVHGFEDGSIWMGGSAGTILRYVNGSFERLATPDDSGTVFGIWGSASDDVWAVGGRPDESGFIWRFSGDAWQPADVPADLIASRAVFKVWGHSASDVRFVGAQGLLLRFDGAQFTVLQSGTDQLLFTVHTDGDGFVAVGGHGRGVILEQRAEETRWRAVAPPAAPGLNGVAERDGLAYAVGENGEVLARRDGQWLRLQTGLDLARDLHSVWVDPDGGIWAVGGHVLGAPLIDGMLIHGRGDNPSTSLGEDALSGPQCTRDGECDDEVFCNGAERCVHGSCELGEPPDCDDGVDCSADACDEALWACRHDAPDRDGDGHGDASCKGANGASLGDDCDDADPSRHPGAQEVCDQDDVDEDCDFATVGDSDDDGDGVTSAACCNGDAHHRQCGGDCDDHDVATHPGADELCDGLDNDCDHRVDEGVVLQLTRDADGDGYGSAALAPELEGCSAPAGYSARGGDCDDGDRAVHPGAVDVCDPDERDEDCDGVGNDPPGGCGCEPDSEQACPLPGACAAGSQPCTELGIWSVSCSIAPSEERCNGLDDDCDGESDEDATVLCYEDADGDGFARANAQGARKCSDADRSEAAGCPDGWTGREPVDGAVDCAPDDPQVGPGAGEVCNGADDDCDGEVDEGLPRIDRYIDADGDGYPGTPAQRCAEDPTAFDQSTDCMDDQALVHPEQTGFFATPACPDGSQACESNALWYCRASAAVACDARLPAARWDYDCNEHDEPIAQQPLPCRTGSCGDGCGTSGFQVVAEPRCGEPAPYQTCRCLGAQGGGCNAMLQMLPLTCR